MLPAIQNTAELTWTLKTSLLSLLLWDPPTLVRFRLTVIGACLVLATVPFGVCWTLAAARFVHGRVTLIEQKTLVLAAQDALVGAGVCKTKHVL